MPSYLTTEITLLTKRISRTFNILPYANTRVEKVRKNKRTIHMSKNEFFGTWRMTPSEQAAQ